MGKAGWVGLGSLPLPLNPVQMKARAAASRGRPDRSGVVASGGLPYGLHCGSRWSCSYPDYLLDSIDIPTSLVSNIAVSRYLLDSIDIPTSLECQPTSLVKKHRSKSVSKAAIPMCISTALRPASSVGHQGMWQHSQSFRSLCPPCVRS